MKQKVDQDTQLMPATRTSRAYATYPYPSPFSLFRQFRLDLSPHPSFICCQRRP